MLLSFHQLWILYPGLFSFTVFSIASVHGNSPQALCGRDTYGSPQLEDCHILLESFANHQDNEVTVFDEEELRSDAKGSWPGVVEIIGVAHLERVVQVPRFFSRSKPTFDTASPNYGQSCESRDSG